MQWKLKDNDVAERISDLSSEDKSKDKCTEVERGVVQVHKSSPSEIYGTIQDGKTGRSFRLVRTDGHNWKLSYNDKDKSTKKLATLLSKCSDLKKNSKLESREITSEEYDKLPSISEPRAELDSIGDTKRLIFISGALGAMTASVIANYYLNKKLKNIPKVNKKNINDIFVSQGLPNNFPAFKKKDLQNAYYQSPVGEGNLKDFTKLHSLDENKISKDQKNKIETQGAIVYDPNFASAGIIAHEGGHAKVQQAGGIRSFNQNYLRPVGGIIGSLAPLIGSLTYATTKSPNLALLAASTSALGYIPTLISEYQATSHANDYLDSKDFSGKGKNHKDVHKDNLITAYGTYAIAPVLTAAAIALQHKFNKDSQVVQNKMDNTDYKENFELKMRNYEDL